LSALLAAVNSDVDRPLIKKHEIMKITMKSK
jgi:hypothetical protein